MEEKEERKKLSKEASLGNGLFRTMRTLGEGRKWLK
jgi:hypothetical protein